jgi:L-alanine-DL-glutamate epimerase-like enolase superfamily enzyme
VTITGVDSFRVEVPLTGAQRRMGCCNATGITRIRTDSGITGYGFAEVDAQEVARLLAGQDPFAVERHLEAGLDRWFGAENALWDIVGKAAGQPLHRLWGAYRDRIPLYLTCVWPGAADQTGVTPVEQARDVRRYVEQGYRAVKIRAWRPDPMEDVEAVRQYSGSTWDYGTALRVARALEALDATWLEEPFARGDIDLHGRLRAEVTIAVTGGEHQPPDVYPGYLRGQAFDIVQPHCAGVFSTLKRIAGMVEMFGASCIFHGSHGMDLVGSFQLAAGIRSCRIQELVYVTPPVLPEEAWAPLGALVKGGTLYSVKDGCVEIPRAPGLGIEVDDAALERYRAGR